MWSLPSRYVMIYLSQSKNLFEFHWYIFFSCLFPEKELNWTILAGCRISLAFCKLMSLFLRVKHWCPIFSCLQSLTVLLFVEWEVMDARVPVTIEARLGYRNKGDPPGQWKEYASSNETRTMDCTPPNVQVLVALLQ